MDLPEEFGMLKRSWDDFKGLCIGDSKDGKVSEEVLLQSFVTGFLTYEKILFSIRRRTDLNDSEVSEVMSAYSQSVMDFILKKAKEEIAAFKSDKNGRAN